MATRTIQPWYFGNTTVRTPLRLRQALILIKENQLEGNLRTREKEIQFNELLANEGIVKLGNDDSYSIGRKWRSALTQQGFLYPLLPKKSNIAQSKIGDHDIITPNGHNLILAETLSAQQECFLRSNVGYFIPNIIESGEFSFTKIFSPLKHFLKIMLELERITNSNKVSLFEQSVIIQFTYQHDSPNNIVNQILDLREKLSKSERKKIFKRDEFSRVSKKYNYVESTFRDYADTTFRYLKITGLFNSIGKGIIISPEKHLFVEQLLNDNYLPENDLAYIQNLCNGAKLPTDNIDQAKLVLDNLVTNLEKKGESFDISNKSVTNVQDINQIRYAVEDRIKILNELDYAKKQLNQWQEISKFMDLLIINKKTTDPDSDDDIEIPKDERPAYFEWTLWRAFLAINKIVMPPYECRKFPIDQDFFPTSTAAGNRPDMFFEFEDYVLVIEVTLTTNARQESAENESVRRHIAAMMFDYKDSNKPVYGLFLAINLDINTVEIFRNTPYFLNDEKFYPQIVPISLSDFKYLFNFLFDNNKVDNKYIREFIERCRKLNNLEAPIWKREISNEVIRYSKTLVS